MNAPKLIAMAKLMRDGIIPDEISLGPESLEQVRDIYRSELENGNPVFDAAYDSPDKARAAIDAALNDTQLLELLPQLKSSYNLYTGMEMGNRYRYLLQEVYQHLGNLHQAILCSERTPQGLLDPGPDLVSQLLQVDLDSLNYSDYQKYLDLVRGISLTPEQREVLIGNLSEHLLNYSPPEAGRVQSFKELGRPKVRDAIKLLQGLLGEEFDDCASSLIEANPEIESQILMVTDKRSFVGLDQ